MKENMHGLLKSLLVGYANRLRADYPELTIRNAAVLSSAVQELHGWDTSSWSTAGGLFQRTSRTSSFGPSGARSISRFGFQAPTFRMTPGTSITR